MRLAAVRGLHHPDAVLPRHGGGVVGAGVRHDDNVELVLVGVREKGAQAAPEHGLLVVGGDDNTGHGGSTVVTEAASVKPGSRGSAQVSAAAYAASSALREFSHDSGPATRPRPSSPMRLRSAGSSSSLTTSRANSDSSLAAAYTAASSADTRASTRSKDTIGLDMAMYSMILFMVDTS